MMWKTISRPLKHGWERTGRHVQAALVVRKTAFAALFLSIILTACTNPKAPIVTPTLTLSPTETPIPTPSREAPSTEVPVPKSATPTPPPTPHALRITPSPPSRDSVLLARDDGSLVLHPLSGDQERVLLGTDMYDVFEDAFLIPIGWPVRLSSDGRWLLVPTPEEGTWLISVDGDVQRQIAPERLTATWAPDSERIVFRDESGSEPRAQDCEVYTQNIVNGGEPRLLARLPEEVSYPTWSPGCGDEHSDQIVVRSGESYTHTVWLLDAASGEQRALGQFLPVPTMGYPDMIRWSPGCDEVWVHTYAGDLAFSVSGGNPRPLVVKDPTLSPDGALRAEIIGSRLIVAPTDDSAHVTYTLPLKQPQTVQWTSEGRRILIESYIGPAHKLWAFDPAVGEPTLVAENVTFLGTLDALRENSTEAATHALTLKTLPPAGPSAMWDIHDLPHLSIRLRVPPAWRFETRNGGDPPSVTLTNFEVSGAQGGAVLGEDHIEIQFALVHRLPTKDAGVWFTRTIELEQHYARVQSTALDGHPAAWVRSLISPVSEELRVPLLSDKELRITRRPISSTQDVVFEQILDGLILSD